MGREYLTLREQLKEQIKALEEKRKAGEVETSTCLELLPEDPGMDGPLVDSEGFPRADIDIAAIRGLRQKIRMLKNDQQEMTEKLDDLLAKYFAHAASPTEGATSSKTIAEGDSDNAAASQQIDLRASHGTLSRPFAVVQRVESGSPADIGGLEVGDRLLRFGSVTQRLQAVPREMRERLGRPTEVEVLRRGSIQKLQVTPGSWAGQGYLGVLFNPI